MTRWLVFLLVLFIAGCSSVPTGQLTLHPHSAEQSSFMLNGRISVKHDGERSSANIRWTHHAEDDDILLMAPLGYTVARIRSDKQSVKLDTADNQYTAHNTGELTENVLGWNLPLAGLRYWVLALPEPDGKAIIEHDVHGQINSIQQDGWELHYTRYAAQTPDSLPLRITAQREGLEIQLVIDQWEIH